MNCPDRHLILGVHITDRLKHTQQVQQLFTEYGCNIKTRVGLHEVEKGCSPNGMILLEMYGEDKVCNELADKLSKVEGVEVQRMVFTH